MTRTSAILYMMLLVAAVLTPAAATPRNLALSGKATASSVFQDSPDMVPAKGIDGDMATRWGGKARGEWFQIDWDKPQTIAGVVLHNYNESWNKGIPFTVQAWDAKLNGGAGGFFDVKTMTPGTATVTFRFGPVTTTRIRLNNLVTFWEVEVYDQEGIAEMAQSIGAMDIRVAGDLLGHLVGTVSRDSGVEPVIGAEIEVSGSTPAGGFRQSVKSGDNGLFQADLPFCATGKIAITAKAEGQSRKLEVQSGDVAKRLTPRPTGSRIAMDGTWDFAVDPPESFPADSSDLAWRKIKTPAHWEMEGFVAESGRAAYRRQIDIPKGWTGKRIKFRSEGIYSKAEVWVNGKRVGGHDGGATPFEIDVTDVAQPGTKNTVTIVVTDHSDAGDLDSMSYYAHLNLGGIWRSLELFSVEPVHASRLSLTTAFDDSYTDAELAVDLDIANEQSSDASDVQVRLTLTDPKGKNVPLDGLTAKTSVGPWAQQRVSLKAKVASPEQWNAERPRLYKLKAEVTAPGGKSSVVEQAVGFREVEIKGRAYTLNGRIVKLWGACHHDADPLLGRAITADLARRDVELMKGCNMTALRSSHYPPNPAVIEAADQLGLYVEDEAPFSFVSVGYGPEAGRTHDLTSDLRLAPLFISLTSELIERDRNSPSAVIWSQCNESAFGRNFRIANEFTKRTDPTRPTSAGQSADLDILTRHNPTSMGRLKDTADSPMPVLFDEGLAIFQGFSAQAQGIELDPGLRDFWVTAHFDPIKGILNTDHQMGSMIWAWVDDAFLVPGRGIEYGRQNLPKAHFVDDLYKLPGRGIIGDPMWGVIDGWRRPRPEWWLAKKLFSPIQVSEAPLKPATPILIAVENRNLFTNLSDYECKWRLGDESGMVKADVAPLKTGSISITPKRAPAASDTLVLEFYDGQGAMIDGYKLAFKPHQMPKLPASGKPARILTESQIYLDFAANVRMIGSNCELAFDRTSGGLMRAIANGEQVLLAGPSLHVMKSFAPLETYPAGWGLTSSDHAIQGGQAVLNWQGKYADQFTGGFAIKMDDAGDVTIDYSFVYNGPEITAREIGIGFDVPLGCDKLEWDRRAEWSYYPDDHIGRPHGTAVAHPSAAQTVPPGERPFGLDDHPWGCNDFRGVKRNIYSASLTDDSGAGIELISDGNQHVRATVGTRSIAVKVLDYYGGSATGTGEWDWTYGVGQTIKTGDAIKGVVRLRMIKGARRDR